MTERNDVTVIVCCYTMDRWDKMMACLDSLREQTLRPDEVVMVVDGNAELAARLRRERKDVTVVALETNQGLSAARNAGIAAVTTTWVAFLDDDATAEPDWLEQLYRACEESGAFGSGGTAVPWLDGAAPSWFPEQLLWTVGCSHKGLPTQRAVVRNVFGGCCLLKTETVREVGGFDVTKGRKLKDMNGGEEADLCLRVQQRHPDAFVVHEPRAVIHHYVPQSRLRPRYVYSRCKADGRTKSKMASSLGAKSLRSELAFVARTPLDAARLVASGRPGAAGVLLGGIGAAAVGAVQGKLDKYDVTSRLREVAGALPNPSRSRV